MPPAEVILGDEFVEPDADIVLKIDFRADEGSPARVFDLAADLIRALEGIDEVLVQSIGTKIETTFILENLQKSSIRVFLRTLLKSTDDDALKSLDWKKQVGSYLVRGKYAAIRWLDGDKPLEGTSSLSDLTLEIARLAHESDVRHLPDYPSPNPTRLAQALDQLQEVKGKFREKEGLTITLGKDRYVVDLEKTWMPSDYVDGGSEERQLSNEMEMILIIKKPDFLGTAQWQFKHGKNTINAPVEDEDWMADFRAGAFPLKPGDALRVRLRFDYTYSEKGDLLETKQQIVRVFGVEHAPTPTPDLFER